MSSNRQWIVDVPASTAGFGSASSADLKIAFPIPDAPGIALSDNDIKQHYLNTVLAASVTDGENATFGVVSLDYSGADGTLPPGSSTPDINAVSLVASTGDGLPGTTRAPNIAPNASPEDAKHVTAASKFADAPFSPIPGSAIGNPVETHSRARAQSLSIGSFSSL